MSPGFPSESFRWSASMFFSSGDRRQKLIVSRSGRMGADPAGVHREAAGLVPHTGMAITRTQQTCTV